MAKIILWKNIKRWGDPNYIETFQQYVMITVIFMDFDAISPLKNCIVTHIKWKSYDFLVYFWNFLEYHRNH